MNPAALPPEHFPRRKWFIAAAIITVLIALVLFNAGSAMPSHAGRTAESWLAGFFAPGTDPARQKETFAAFQAMGAEGVSYLITMLNANETFLSRGYARTRARLPVALRCGLPEPINRGILCTAASIVLNNLRDPAPERSFPQLVRLLSASDFYARSLAANSIQQYSLNYPQLDLAAQRAPLERALNDPDDMVRIDILLTLERAHLASAAMIPALESARTNLDQNVRLAAQTLRERLAATKP